MGKQHTCPQGHSWESPEEVAHDTMIEAICPVCAAAQFSDKIPPPPPVLANPPEGLIPTVVDPVPVPAAVAVGKSLPAIAGYEILAELGRGGMGVVYEARQLSPRRLVALKVILTGPFAGAEELSRFRSEADAIAQLQHPNIVQIHEVGEQNGQPYFSLEFVGGGSLDRKLAGTPQPARAAAQVVQTLARAVHAAHQSGIIHRDLKPANILLQESGARSQESGVRGQGSGVRSQKSGRCPLIVDFWIPKITDFGLAKQLASDTQQTHSGAIMGTPSYMAPEQAMGKSKARAIGPACDIYALGAILYEMLTGRPPFKGETALDTLQLVMSQEPVPPCRLQPKIPRDLETICLKCLQKAPHNRYSSALALAEDLDRFLHDQPIVARPASTLYRLRKFTQRNKGLVAGVALIFLALVGGIIGTSLGLAEARTESAHALKAQGDAEAAERETRRLLAESYCQNAHLAMQRGAWRAGLDQIDKALAAGHDDSPAFRLDKVRALAAVHEGAKALNETKSLSQRPDLGSLEGRVRLWQADLRLGQSVGDETALKMVREAVKLGGLLPAEAAYAQGLLAQTTPEAIRHFQDALDKDPWHQRASAMLITLLTLQGRREEARNQILVGESFFPEDPTFRLLHAQLDALEGNMAAAKASLERARSQLGNKQLEAAQAHLELVSKLRTLHDLVGGESASPTRALLGFLPTLTRAAGTMRNWRAQEANTVLFLPVPPVLLQAFSGLADTMPLALVGINLKAGQEALGRALTKHPDGLLYLLRGNMYGVSKRWAEAEEMFVLAAKAPSLIPIRPAALYFAASSEWVLTNQGPIEQRAEMKRRSIDHIRQYVMLGDVRPDHGFGLSTAAIHFKEFELARWVIREWERRFPKDSRLLEQRAYVEFNSGSHAKAIELADQLLMRKVTNTKRWQQLRRNAVAGLQKQAEAMAPK
jgi:serine/threonine protein kinase